MINARPGAEGTEISIASGGQEPGLHLLMAAQGATYRGGGRWTVSPRLADQLVQAATDWLRKWDADGRRPTGLSNGQHGAYYVEVDDGFYRVIAPKAYTPTIKRLGGQWDGERFRVPFDAGPALQLEIERAQHAAAKASEFPLEMPGGKVWVRADGVICIQLPKDQTLTDAVKSVPTARWDAAAKVWTINPRFRLALRKALARVATYAADRLEVAREASAAARVEQQRKTQEALVAVQAFFEGCAPEGKEFVLERCEAGAQVRLVRATIEVVTPYSKAIVELLRGAGCRWDPARRVWSVRDADAGPLMEAMPQVIAASAEVLAEQARKRADIQREKDQQRAAEMASRVLVLSAGAPAVGECLRHGDQWRVVERLGKEFRADEDTSSISGLVGVEGEWVRYAYTRAATPEEAAVAAAVADARRRANELRRAGKAALSAAARFMQEARCDAPRMAAAPNGRWLLAIDPTQDLYGYGEGWVIDGNGVLWHVKRQGADGDDWGANNAPGSIVRRAPPVERLDEWIAAAVAAAS